jgi:hypothetical protein
MKMIKSVLSTTTAALLLTSAILGAQAPDHSKETRNLINFDLVDFVGWNNNDMDVMRTYHGALVKVNMAGYPSEGIDAHIQAIQQSLRSNAPKIVQHWPQVAEGDWTCVVGVSAQPGFSMATLARWPADGGGMTEERVYVRQLSADETRAVDISRPELSVVTPDDAALRAATGAGSGWRCVVATNTVIFTHTVNGRVEQQLGFASH